MFRKKMILASAVFLPAATLWIFLTTWVRDRDVARYRELIRERELVTSTPQTPTHQQRKGVQKDIWFSQGRAQRLHYQICSKGSLLTLTTSESHCDIIESLEGIQCWMQEHLTPEGAQQLRFIEADSGIYRHATQKFTASHAHISLFELPGHTLPQTALPKEDAYLTGVARDLSFFFSGHTPQFQAHQFRAKVVKE